MKRRKILAIIGICAAVTGVFTSCDKDLIEYEHGDIKIAIEKGDEWLYDFPLFLGITKKTPPQLAIWIEDLAGNYISTIYVSHKIATESWQFNDGNRRKESLPVWCYARGVVYPDGLYVPTKDQPVIDGVTGATPLGSFDVKLSPVNDLKQFVVKAEVNQSKDWNDHYPKEAKEGDANYSGGAAGSGQPALVYSATIDLDSDTKQYTANIVGHSSPDGSNGEIYADLSSLTTAIKIVKQITVHIQ